MVGLTLCSLALALGSGGLPTRSRVSPLHLSSGGLLGQLGGFDASLIDASLDKLAAINAENLAIKEQNEILGRSTGGVKPLTKCSVKVMQSKPAALAKLLQRDGAVSVTNVLSEGSADALLGFINTDNEACKREILEGRALFDARFGGVNCRGQNGMFGFRQDQYLPMSNPMVRAALSEVIRVLEPLLGELTSLDGMIHEASSFVADPGAPRQCIHADTIVLPCPQYPSVSMDPLYTIFIALQDVASDMGHTVFLPSTHTSEAHILWNTDQSKKEKFLEKQPVVQSALKKGDVSIFDSRVLHCGCANSSKQRRVLAYLTVSRQQRWPLPNGLHGSNSIRAEDRWKYQIKDLL